MIPQNEFPWLMNNLGVSLFIFAAIISFLHKCGRWRMPTSEIIYRWFVLLPVGFGLIYSFIMHAFYPAYTAALIGWPDSPFQTEVATASLGIGLIAILSFNASAGFRWAAVISILCFMWGDAWAHLYKQVMQHNFTFSGACSCIWLDLLMPLILLLSLISLKSRSQ